VFSYSRLRHEIKDDWNWIRIVDVFPQGHRYLYFEESAQGAIDLNNHGIPALEYVGLMAAAATAHEPAPRKACLGGLGTGALLHCLERKWGARVRLTAIESDSRIYELAKRFFRVSARSRVMIGDFRERLMAKAFNNCDLILVDCYSAASIPAHLTTAEFMMLVREKLSDVGTAVFNVWNPGCNAICGRQVRTILAAFDRVASVACREDANIIVLARKSGGSPWPESLSFKGIEYPLEILDGAVSEAWPQWVGGCEPLSDENARQAFAEVGLDL